MTDQIHGDDPRPLDLQPFRLTVEIRGSGRKVFDSGAATPAVVDDETNHEEDQ